MFGVVVTFFLADRFAEEFLSLVTENARRSLAEEPGCHRFDVCTDVARPGEVFLYELYADRAAFEAHLMSAHFAEFEAHVGSMEPGKIVHTYDTVVA